MGLVPGAEIEDPTASAYVATAAAEDLAAGEPAHQDKSIRLGHVEVLPVHLLVLDDEALPEARGDLMRRIDDPDPFALACFAPIQVAAGPHEPPEYLRVMAGVQDDQAHPVE